MSDQDYIVARDFAITLAKVMYNGNILFIFNLVCDYWEKTDGSR